MDRDSFFADDRIDHEVIHCLLIVGEAVKHVRNHVRDENAGSIRPSGNG
jgi:uncharacterized protein with HEPN domain